MNDINTKYQELDELCKSYSIFTFIMNKHYNIGDFSNEEWLNLMNYLCYNYSFNKNINLNNLIENFKTYLLLNTLKFKIDNKEYSFFKITRNTLTLIIKAIEDNNFSLMKKRNVFELFQIVQILLIILSTNNIIHKEYSFNILSHLVNLVNVLKERIPIESHFSNLIYLIIWNITIANEKSKNNKSTIFQLQNFSFEIPSKNKENYQICQSENFSYFYHEINLTKYKVKHQQDIQYNNNFHFSSFVNLEIIAREWIASIKPNIPKKTSFIFFENISFYLISIGLYSLGLSFFQNDKKNLIFILKDQSISSISVNNLLSLLSSIQKKGLYLDCFDFSFITSGKLLYPNEQNKGRIKENIVIYISKYKYLICNKLFYELFQNNISNLYLFYAPIMKKLYIDKGWDLCLLIVAYLDIYYSIFNKKEKKPQIIKDAIFDNNNFNFTSSQLYYYPSIPENVYNVQNNTELYIHINKFFEFFVFLCLEFYFNCNLKTEFKDFFDSRYLLNISATYDCIVSNIIKYKNFISTIKNIQTLMNIKFDNYYDIIKIINLKNKNS